MPVTEAKTYWGGYPPVGVTPPGDPVSDVFTEDPVTHKLTKVGTRNIQEEIQASAEGTTIYEILDRCVKTGDVTPLSAVDGVFGDYSGAPETLSEAKNLSDSLDRREADLAAEAAKAAQAPAEPVKPVEVEKKADGGQEAK